MFDSIPEIRSTMRNFCMLCIICAAGICAAPGGADDHNAFRYPCVISCSIVHLDERMITDAIRISGDLVRANLLEVYAQLSGETARESK